MRPISPARLATATPAPAAATPLAVSNRDCETENEPSALPLTRKAATPPFWAFLRKSRPSAASARSAAWRLANIATTIVSEADPSFGCGRGDRLVRCVAVRRV